MAAAGRPRFLRQTTPHPVHGAPPTAAAAAQSVPTPLGGSQAPVGGSSGGGEHAALWHARQASPEQSIDGDLPYCEQLAAAGDWRPQPVDMEASYEGITELNPHECARQLEDRLPRWPDFTTGGVLRFGDYLGTVTFSMTGTLTALGAGMDVLGGCVVGTITAVGGGTIRDVLIARDENGHSKRAFWMDEPEYLYISLVSSLVTFYYWNELAEAWQLDQSDAWIFWLDSLGIAAFCSIGCMHGIRAGLPWVVCALCGMMTSTFGGMTRDVLTHRPVRILHSHSEIYALTAFSGATAYLAARALGFSYAARATAAFCTAVGLRYLAWTSDIKLPVLDSIYSAHEHAPLKDSPVDDPHTPRKPGHSSGAEAMHKREYQRLAALLQNGALEADNLIRRGSALASFLQYGAVNDVNEGRPKKTISAEIVD